VVSSVSCGLSSGTFIVGPQIRKSSLFDEGGRIRTPHNPTISVLLLGVSMLLSVACSRRPSDDTIAKDIQNKVATDPATKDSQVNVVAKDGKVTLSGAVSDLTAQQKVEQIAREEPGVAGQAFSATLTEAVAVGGRTVLPAGSKVSGTVVTAKAKGKVKGEGQLDLKLTSVSAHGQTFPIDTVVLSSTVTWRCSSDYERCVCTLLLDSP
jgi:BON domain